MTLLHGDCLELIKNMPDSSVDLILADPPYGMEFRSNFREEKYEKISGDDKFFLTHDLMVELNRVLKANSHIYIFCSFHLIDKFKQAIEQFFEFKNILIWEKNNTSMGDLFGDYAPKYEMIIYGQKGKRNLNMGRHENIVRFDRTGNEFHPTEKPVKLCEFLIKKSTQIGDNVLDFTMGSGSTGIAAKNLDREFVGMEINENFFNIAKKRIESNIVQTGFSFD